MPKQHPQHLLKRLQEIKDLGLDHINPKIVKGKIYIYFRSPIDGKLTPLPSDETSVDFKLAYQACLKSIEKQAIAVPKKKRELRPVTSDGTIGKGIMVYRKSLEYLNLKDSTKKIYAKPLEILNDRLGAGQLVDLDSDAIDIYSEEITLEMCASAADRQTFLISNIWNACKKHPEFKIKGMANPVEEATLRYKTKRPARPWTDAEQTLFMQTAPETLKMAKLLLHFGAQRGGDSVKMLWEHFDGKGIWVTPEKTNANPDPLPNYHRCPKPLLDALLAAERVSEYILTNSLGKPWADSMCLSQSIRNHLIKIGLAKRGTRTISQHGLRKNAASEVAELLVGTAGIKTVTGQRTDEMANFYSEHANKRAMNAMVVDKWDEAIEAKEKAVKRKAAGIRRVK
jgi:integrase